MRTRVYVDGVASWTENVPSRARIPWSLQGSISGVIALSSTASKLDRSEAVVKGWETRRLSNGQIRGEGLEP